MKAVILAAGIASRLRPLTDTTPKCLLKIGERCLLERAFDALIQKRDLMNSLSSPGIASNKSLIFCRHIIQPKILLSSIMTGMNQPTISIHYGLPVPIRMGKKFVIRQRHCIWILKL